MKKKTKVILVLTIIVIIIGTVSLWPKKTTKYDDKKVIIPERVVSTYTSSTGAKDISLSEREYGEVYLIRDLRNKVPIDRNYFTINFDYKINKFIVRYKDEGRGKSEFLKWLKNTGYDQISSKYFQYQ